MAQTKTDPIGALAYLDSTKTDTQTPTALPTSDAILANMQKRMDELTSPKNQLENALQKAHAWTLYNKAPAFKNIAEQENEQANQLQNIGTTMAQIKMQRDQLAQSNRTLGFDKPAGTTTSTIGGAPTGGSPTGGVSTGGFDINSLPRETQLALQLETSPAKRNEILANIGKVKLENITSAQLKLEYGMNLPEPQKEMFMRENFPELYKPRKGVTPEGQEYNIPPFMSSAPAPAPTPAQAPQTTALPANVSSGPGPRVNPLTGATEQHAGHDIPLAANTPVTVKTNPLLSPIMGGKVLDVKPTSESGGYGNTAVIQGTDGKNYRLAHFNDVNVKPGDTITSDTVIGASGNTGKSRGNHLHIEKINEPTAVAKPVTPKTLDQLEIEKKEKLTGIESKGKGEAKEYELLGKTAADEAAQTLDNWHTAETTIGNAKETKLLADRNKATLGIFKKAGPGVALANTLNEGLKLGIAGEIKVPLEELAVRLVPGSSDQAIKDRERLTSLLGDQNFQFVRMNKNQGSWSDIERKAVSGIIGTVSNSADFIKRRAELLELRGEFDQKLGDAWRSYQKANQGKALYSQFQNTDAYENAVKDYKTALRTNFHKEYLNGSNSGVSLSDKSKSIMDRYPQKP